MEHNDNEQHANPDAYRPMGQPHYKEDAGASHAADASASVVPAVLARLGLSSTAPSPTTSEELAVDALTSQLWPVRLAAVQQLETLAEPVQLTALLRALRDEHAKVRTAAARALVKHA